MGESPSSAMPRLSGLTIEAVEWLPSGADSGLVRVRGRWTSAEAALPGLPELVLRAGGADHRFESLPDARFARDPASWRGSYLVPGLLVTGGPDVLWVEWPGGVRSGLPELSPGLAQPPAPEPAQDPEPEEEGGQVIDRAVLAERRARRAEEAERAQARVAAEALRAVEALELQSAGLERRLAEREAPSEELAELRRVAERRQAALSGALESLARLRRQTREWRSKLRTGEISRAGDAVRLAVLEAERVSAGEAARRAEASASERMEALRAELEEAREQAEGRLAAALAAAEETRAALERRQEGERAVFEEVRSALQQRLDEAERRAAALAAAHEELIGGRDAAETRAAALGARVSELEAALEAAETRLAAAEAAAATAEVRLRVESVARAALEDELDREREARAGLAADLAAAREAAAGEAGARAAELEAQVAGTTAARDALQAQLEAVAGERDSFAARLEAVAGERDSFAARLEAERARRAAAESARSAEADLAAARAARDAAQDEALRVRAELEDERDARRQAEFVAAERDSLQDRIAELDRRNAGLADEVRLEQAAREQAEAAAAAARRPEAETAQVVAGLDAAAAALRGQAPPPAASIVGSPTQDVEHPTTDDGEAEVPAAAAPPERPRPTIVSTPKHPPRLDATGKSARQYPPLRGAIVKLAHDDPTAAGRLLAALLPAQSAAVATPIDYDLTIREVGTFAVTVSAHGTEVRELRGPRPRGQAELHLVADALTLAELLAGVPKRVGRLFGPARFKGSKRGLAVLKAIPATSLTIAEAARAGAELPPGLVYRALSYAVHPSWTKGQRFTVAQEITGEAPETWYLTARNGAGLAVSDRAPEEGADASVTMTREAFSHLLRGEVPPRGERPTVRGDTSAVGRMKAWTDRAQGH